MRKQIKAWLSATCLRRQDRAMPCFPTARPSVLTPTTSKEDLTSLSQISPIFSKLPTEIRRQILVMAFGDRTLHMDLALLPSIESADFERFKGLCSLHTAYAIESRSNKGRSLSWQWRGYQCNRKPPSEYYTLVQFEEYEITPADDECSRTYGCDIERHLCWIGAMGWLLSCRQAYVLLPFYFLFYPS